MLRTVAFLSVLMGTAVHAQTQQSTQGWLLVTGSGRFAEKFRWYGEVQPRSVLSPPSVERLLVRAAIGYQLTEKVSGWFGYGWTPLISPAFADEQRPFLQALLEDTGGAVKFINRSRFEARFIQVPPSGPLGARLENDLRVSLRVRHMLRAVAPLGDSGFAVAAYDELFVNVSPTLTADQNRLFAGASYAVNKSLTVEAGYIWNHVWRPAQATDRTNHIALLWLSFSA